MNRLTLAIFALFLSAPLSAAEYDGFYNITGASLRSFTADLGGLLGSGSAQSARSLGFSGFDVGVRAVTQLKPSHNNTALKKNSAFGLGLVQAEIGMPYRLDGFVRAGSYEGLTVAGGGLRYGLWNVTDEKYKINAMLVMMGNMAVHKYFYAVHFNTTLVCSMNVPRVAPYVAVGFDSTRLEAQTLADTTLSGKQVHAFEPRYSAGLRTKLGLAYLSGGITYTHDRPAYNASTGFRF